VLLLLKCGNPFQCTRRSCRQGNLRAPFSSPPIVHRCCTVFAFNLSLLSFLSFSKDKAARFICLTSCPNLTYPNQPLSLIASVAQSFSGFMPAYLSFISSSLVVYIVALKFVVAVWWLFHELTHPKPIVTPNSVCELKLWLDMGISTTFFFFGELLLVFSFVRLEEKGLQIILSLTKNSLVVY
jgi:hypothetical protein